MTKIRCAIAGLGRIGSELESDSKREKPATHAGVIHRHPETFIAAGCDPDSSKREHFRAQWGVNALYESLDDLLDQEKIDIVHIATPPETHLDLVRSAVQHGTQVIILEKPVASSLEEAEQIVSLQQNRQSKIIVNHERRYSLQYQHIRKIITEQTYGSLLSINARLYMGRKRALHQMLYDDGTHMIDLFAHLTGDPLKPISVHKVHQGTCAFIFGECGSIPISFETGAGRDHLVFELDLSFTSGRILVGNGYYKEYESKESPFYTNYRSLIRNEKSFTHSRYFSSMFEEAVALFKGHALVPVSSVHDGLSALKVIEDILQTN